jgi:glucokinase
VDGGRTLYPAFAEGDRAEDLKRQGAAMKKILAADIGGTNSRLAYFQWTEEQSLSLIESKTMESLSKKIPVFLKVNEESGLGGAALCAVQRLKAAKFLSTT